METLPNRPRPSTATDPEPSHFSDEETEAQRGIAVGPGSHSMLEQSEAQNPGSHGQGLGPLQDTRGHLLPTQQECPGLNTPLLRRSTGRQGPASGPQGMLGAVWSSHTPMPRLQGTKALSEGLMLAPFQPSSFCQSRWEAYLIHCCLLVDLGRGRA